MKNKNLLLFFHWDGKIKKALVCQKRVLASRKDKHTLRDGAHLFPVLIVTNKLPRAHRDKTFCIAWMCVAKPPEPIALTMHETIEALRLLFRRLHVKSFCERRRCSADLHEQVDENGRGARNGSGVSLIAHFVGEANTSMTVHPRTGRGCLNEVGYRQAYILSQNRLNVQNVVHGNEPTHLRMPGRKRREPDKGNRLLRAYGMQIKKIIRASQKVFEFGGTFLVRNLESLRTVKKCFVKTAVQVAHAAHASLSQRDRFRIPDPQKEISTYE